MNRNCQFCMQNNNNKRERIRCPKYIKLRFIKITFYVFHEWLAAGVLAKTLKKRYY